MTEAGENRRRRIPADSGDGCQDRERAGPPLVSANRRRCLAAVGIPGSESISLWNIGTTRTS